MTEQLLVSVTQEISCAVILYFFSHFSDAKEVIHHKYGRCVSVTSDKNTAGNSKGMESRLYVIYKPDQ